MCVCVCVCVYCFYEVSVKKAILSLLLKKNTRQIISATIKTTYFGKTIPLLYCTPLPVKTGKNNNKDKNKAHKFHDINKETN